MRCVSGAAVMRYLGDGFNVKIVGRFDGLNVKGAGTRSEMLWDGVNVKHDAVSVLRL